MFLPVGSNLPFFRLPYVTLCWMGFCVLLFLGITRPDLLALQGNVGLSFKDTYTYFLAVVPSQTNEVWKFFSYQFVHASLGHLLSNMWYLLVFGWILENALGAQRYILFTLLAGAVAVLPELVVQSETDLPIVGASGSVAFILGSVAFMYPRAKIKLLFMLLPIPNTPSSFFLPLRYLIYFWLAIQVSGLAMHYWVEAKPIAYATHLTGFMVGGIVGTIYHFIRAKGSRFVDIDLSGKDLRRFYESLSAYQEKDFDEANRNIQEISDANPWMLNLQLQLMNFSLQFRQKQLSDQVWKNTFRGVIALKKSEEARQILGRYFEVFGEIPNLEVQERVQLRKLVGALPTDVENSAHNS